MADELDLYQMQQRYKELVREGRRLEDAYVDAKEAGDAEVLRQASYGLMDNRARIKVLDEAYTHATRPAPVAPQPTLEERAHRSWDRLDADDLMNIYRGSKYTKTMDWSDPHVLAGIAEVQRRKQSGEP